MISNIANEIGDTLNVEIVAIDSYTLEKHYNDKNTINKINSNTWDFVVLQEQSQRPVFDISTFCDQTLKYSQKLLELIMNNNPNCEVLLFMTWGRRYGDTELCSKLPYTCSFEEMQNKLIERYELLADYLGISVVPCGRLWKKIILDDDTNINPFFTDNSHPNEIGSFMNAMLFYSVFTNKLIEKFNYNPVFSLNDNEFQYLISISNFIYQTYFP